MRTQTRAATYARISRDRDGEAEGVHRQLVLCRREVDEQGWLLVGEYVDNDMSAYKRRDRAQFDRLVRDITAGLIDVVVTTHIDRLNRRVSDYLELFDALRGAGCWVRALRSSDIDPEDPGALLTGTVLSAVAQQESSTKASRLVDKHRSLAEGGRYQGGPRPYGYRQSADGSLVQVPEEAAVIREAAERMLAGESPGSICRDLNSRRVPTISATEWRTADLERTLRRFDTGQLDLDVAQMQTLGQVAARVAEGERLDRIVASLRSEGVPVVSASVWRTPTLRSILTSPRIAGKRGYVGEEARRKGDRAESLLADNACPPIVTEAEWQALRRIIRDPSRRRGPSGGHRYLLTSGIAVCGRCGAPLHARRKQSGARAMACIKSVDKDGCGRLEVAAHHVEDFVRDYVCDLVDASNLDDFIRHESLVEVGPLLDELRSVEERIRQLEAGFAAGDLDYRQFARLNKDFNLRRQTLEEQIQTATQTSPVTRFAGKPGLLAQTWNDLSLDQRRLIVRAIIKHVVIEPAQSRGRDFKFSRIRIERRA